MLGSQCSKHEATQSNESSRKFFELIKKKNFFQKLIPNCFQDNPSSFISFYQWSRVKNSLFFYSPRLTFTNKADVKKCKFFCFFFPLMHATTSA